MQVNGQFMIGDRGGNVFALPLLRVVRVAMSPRICEAPLMPTGYVGVIDFEGEAVPVWDPFPESADAMWGATVIVADGAAGRIGFLSDAPPRVASGNAGEGEHPQGARGSPPGSANARTGSMWREVVQVGEAPVPVLDPTGL